MWDPVPLWIISVGLDGMSTDDQFTTYDLSFLIAMSTPNIMQNADIMSAFLFSDSSVADDVIRSSIYAELCVYVSFPGSPGSSILSFLFQEMIVLPAGC